MVYEYRCEPCDAYFDVVKSVRHMEDAEHCPSCKRVAIRQFAPGRLYLSRTAVQEAEYNPGLGCVVKNRQEREEICKARGLEEVGNEKPETLHKHFDSVREQKREREWAQADKGWVGAE